MKVFHGSFIIIIASIVLFTSNVRAQSELTATELNDIISNNKFLITYRDGEAVYGTYFFVEIHYCSSGYYGLYGKSVKQTVLGNEQHNNWQEFGNWKVMEYEGRVGIYSRSSTFQESFVPVLRLPDGNLFIGEGITIVNQGKAICNW